MDQLETVVLGRRFQALAITVDRENCSSFPFWGYQSSFMEDTKESFDCFECR